MLTDADGRTFPALIERSPIDNAREGIAALAADLDAQDRAIDLAFVSSLSTDDDVTAWPDSPSSGGSEEASAVARGILDDLVASVVRGTAPRFPRRGSIRRSPCPTRRSGRPARSATTSTAEPPASP